MYGDYSRGHEPDRKRGRAYRRVLLQMGRPVLDSDVAALVDAVLGEVRTAARGLGCAAGSPDLGFLVTPGRLLALFAAAADRLEVVQGAPDAWVDYRFRLAGRYPALQLAAPSAGATVRFRPLAAIDPATGPARAALWAHVEDPTNIRVNGIPVALLPQSPEGPQRVMFDTAAATLRPLDIELPAGAQVWLFALEQDEAAGSEPAFWVAGGSYQLDGLIVDAHGGGSFPAVSYPAAAGFPWDGSPAPDPPLDGLAAPPDLVEGTRLVAYLEAWERHVTAVEDSGVREEALGGTDTTARTQLLGQVKLATAAGAGLPADAGAAAAKVRDAFEALQVSGGQVTVDARRSTETGDPCALPDLAGYSGTDNRLYRVEVHDGGGLGQLRLKWSRDNGAELFPVKAVANDQLVFPAGIALAGGDIVELLNHVVDLGDDAFGRVEAAAFVPPTRAVGQLVRLEAMPAADDDDDVVFRLVRPDTNATVVLDDRYKLGPEAVLKVRRWHGILTAGGSAGPHALEDGLTITLSSTGTYRPGQYWQYEARVRADNANGPWRPEPHGPERRFAPLALLEYDGAREPLRLLAWLDERFSHPCDLDADGVGFAGGRVGSASDTVQEAIEELFERPPEIVDASCGELIIRPENDPQAVFDTIPAGGHRRICIHPGVWELGATVFVQGKGDLVISGAGAATRLVGDGVDCVLRFQDCGRVRIQDLVVDGVGPGEERDGLAGALSAIDCAGFDAERVTAVCAGHPGKRVSAIEVRSELTAAAGVPEVRVRDCRIEAGHAQVGVLVVNPATVDIEANTVGSAQQPRDLVSMLGAPEVIGLVAPLVIDRNWFIGVTEEANNELLVGSPNILEEFEPVEGRRKFIAHLAGWGNQFITFTTPLALAESAWRSIFDDNPLPFAGDAPAEVVEGHLRKVRRKLLNSMFNLPGGAQLTPTIRNLLLAAGEAIAAENAITAGGQGIVVAGRGSGVETTFPEPRRLPGDPRPDARIVGNRVLGFVQGIHVGAGFGKARGLSYRVTVADNLVHLRFPGAVGERHGIFVGGAYHLRVEGNTVELRTPGPDGWAATPATDGIRAWGTFGPLIRLRSNDVVGTSGGVLAHATNHARSADPGWHWIVDENTHVSASAPVPQTRNW